MAAGVARLPLIPVPAAGGRRRAAEYGAVALEGLVALSAYGGGIAMVADPTGALIGFPPEMVDRLPVDSWLVPGIALAVSNGVVPTVVAVATLRGRAWTSRFGHVVVGGVLLAWPVTETLVFGYPLESEPGWLRPVVAGTGIAIGALGLWLRRRSAQVR